MLSEHITFALCKYDLVSILSKLSKMDTKLLVFGWITDSRKPRWIFTNNKTRSEQKLVTVKWSRFRTYVIERWRLICIARRFMLMSLIYCYFYLILGIIIWTVSVWMRIIFYALRKSFPQLWIDPGVRIIFAFSTFIALLCVAVCYSAVPPFVVRRKRWIGQKTTAYATSAYKTEFHIIFSVKTWSK